MQAARREAVLTVTHDLIAERGLSGIATLEVAKRAGVSEGLIFQHLETKAGLPAAAARSGETLLACLEAVAEAPPCPRSVRHHSRSHGTDRPADTPGQRRMGAPWADRRNRHQQD
jgi:AcrR family transcriptional regulator